MVEALLETIRSILSVLMDIVPLEDLTASADDVVRCIPMHASSVASSSRWNVTDDRD